MLTGNPGFGPSLLHIPCITTNADTAEYSPRIQPWFEYHSRASLIRTDPYIMPISVPCLVAINTILPVASRLPYPLPWSYLGKKSKPTEQTPTVLRMLCLHKVAWTIIRHAMLYNILLLLL